MAHGREFRIRHCLDAPSEKLIPAAPLLTQDFPGSVALGAPGVEDDAVVFPVENVPHVRLELLVDRGREFTLEDGVLHPGQIAPPHLQCPGDSLFPHIVDHDDEHGYHLETKGS